MMNKEAKKMNQEKKYREIKRNRDEDGHIITYSVKLDNSDYWMEYNTLKEARLMALIIE